MRSNLDTAHQAARAITSATVETYEAAIRAITEVQWMLARTLAFEPLSSISTTCAELTRDTAAIQLSIVRWILDL